MTVLVWWRHVRETTHVTVYARKAESTRDVTQTVMARPASDTEATWAHGTVTPSEPTTWERRANGYLTGMDATFVHYRFLKEQTGG